ncbi:AzlC family ABC transporter permease [Marinomonas epiphytica]
MSMQVARKGMLASIPMLAGGAPFGLLFGSLAAANDLGVWFAVAMSSIVFAGSAQFVALGLIATDAPIWVIVFTTFVVNLRHLLYAADMVKFVKHLPFKLRLLMGFGLIDETYAAVRPMYRSGQVNTTDGHFAYLGSFISFYLMWNVTTLLGVISGELIPGMSEWGLEFAMVATFIGIVTPYFTRVPFVMAGLSALVASLLLHTMPNNLGMLLAALIGVSIGYVCDCLGSKESVQGGANDCA